MTRLGKEKIADVMENLGSSKVVNLNVSVGEVMDAVRKAGLERDDTVGLHVLCCNEYFLVTE